MHVLLVGGTRFVGHFLAWRLLAEGHRLTVFHRGMTADSLPARVERLHGDRTTDDFERLLRGRTFDACVDFAGYTAADTARVVQVLDGRVGHYVFVSTGQVYLVRTDCPAPARESDYEGPLMAEPLDPLEHDEWKYGVDKRAAEDVLSRAHADSGFAFTTLRIPMVNGERDYHRRLEGYARRLLDGGPVVLPGGGHEVCRHVYGRDVARQIAALLGDPQAFGRAYNLANAESLTTRALLTRFAQVLGATPRFVPIPVVELEARGIRAKEISPFSQRWMSLLDPSLAQRELGFVATPLDTQLECIVASLLAHMPQSPPEGYRHRAIELELAARG